MKYGVYPYLDKYALLVEYLIEHNKYNITTLIQPKAWPAADPGFDNVTLMTSFNEAVDSVDAVIFLDNAHYKDCIKKLERCIKLKTDAVCCIAPKGSDLPFLKDLAEEHGVNVTFLDGMDYETRDKIQKRNDRYQTQESVVAAVGSLFNGGVCFDSELVLKLVNSFKAEGYTVTVLASDRNFQLCGFHSVLPYNLDGLSDDPDGFILGLNAYYNYIQMVEKSDVIILQLPQEGLFKMFDNIPCGFGIRSFIISQAIDVDYFTLVSGVDQRENELYNKLSELFDKRYGFEINSVAVNSCYVDYYDSLEKGSIVCMKISEESAREVVGSLEGSKSSDIIYGSYNDNNIGDIICKDCIDKLSSD